jgi:hypothetical protein
MSGTATQEEVEQQARDLGWRPRGEYSGSRPFVGPEEFIRRAERMLPLQAAARRAAEKKNADLARELEEHRQLLADLTQSTRRAEQVGYNRARRELEQERARAITDGDVERVRQVEREITDLGTPPAAPTPPPPPKAQPEGNPEDAAVVQAWQARNAYWFNTDPVANAAAVQMLNVVQAQHPDMSLAEALVEVEDRIKERFDIGEPGRGNAPRRRRTLDEDEAGDEDDTPPPTRERTARAASSVLPSGSAPPRRAGPRSFEAMPASAKQQYERWKTMLQGKGEPLTREEFANNYWEQYQETEE